MTLLLIFTEVLSGTKPTTGFDPLGRNVSVLPPFNVRGENRSTVEVDPAPGLSTKSSFEES